MLKRTWIVVIGLLVLGLALSACDAESELAPELTPIPTLPPGEEPALVDALQQAPVAEEMAEAAEPAGDLLEIGEQLFVQTCAACHMDVDTIGPGLPHIAEAAPTIAAELGMSTEEYLHQSIVDPAAYVVEGFQPIMPPAYGDQYTEDEIQALIAYILAQGEEANMDAAPAEENTTEDTMGADEAMSADEGTADAETKMDEAPADENDVGATVDEELAAQGKQLFAQTCMACHMDADTIGPGLPHIAESAPQIAAELGMSTEEYLHQSIVDPAAYVVEGFQPIMPPAYGDQYTEDEIQALIAYILAQGKEAESSNN